MGSKGKNYPKYSVLMTVYYKEKAEFLREAIESMLNQTVKPSEFVLVEDGPLTDELYEAIAEYKKNPIFNIVVLKENQGSGLASAAGVLACSNEWIARLDSDDYSVPERIEKQFNVIMRDSRIDIIGTDVVEFEKSKDNIVSRVNLPENDLDLKKFAKKRCPLRNSSILFKRNKVIDAGNYQELRYAEDYDLYIRQILQDQTLWNIREPLVYVRTDKSFFERRGGIKYAKLIHGFKKKQYKRGFYTFFEYVYAAYPHIAVCLMPNWMRTLVYKKLLRK